MAESSSFDQIKKTRRLWILLILLLAVFAWVSRYWSSAVFGLYDDGLLIAVD